MIPRDITNKIKKASEQYKVISITGPRQSGKTTLVKNLFTDYLYTNLENPDTRIFAMDDPKAFLFQSNKMVIDEIQNVPELLSYIQTIVDEDKYRKFIITGSQNLLISERVSQSLAGRVAIFTLLPLSISELKKANLLSTNLVEQMYKGYYPRIYDEKLEPNLWFDNYIQTYIERDVRQIKSIGDLGVFQRFLGLIAGRTGQILNMNSLSNDAGVSVPTIESWISILEATYILFKIQPYYENFNKRLIKSPKIHFYDTGLVCALLGINSALELQNHPLVGNIFESSIASNLVKNFYNSSERTQVYYWREKTGKEIDLLYTEGRKTYAYEIKFGKTLNSSMTANLLYFKELSQKNLELKVIYGGDEDQRRTEYSFVSWKTV